MWPWLAAARFCLGSPGPAAKEEDRPAPGASYVRLYHPQGRSRGLLFTVHGMSILGVLDPRWVRVSRSLASLGFTVAAMQHDQIAGFRLDSRHIDEICATGRALSDDPALCPSGRLGLFSVSFSAALLLIAATRPALQDRVSGMLALGAYGDCSPVMRGMMSDKASDDFGRSILLGNYLERALGPRPALAEAFFARARDNWHKAERELPTLREALSPEDRALLDQLRSDSAARVDLWERIAPKIAEEAFALNALRVVGQLRAPLTLVHGDTDHVMPYSESLDLAQAHRAAGQPTRVVITPLLTHGDRTLKPSSVLALPALLGAFAGYFADVNQAG